MPIPRYRLDDRSFDDLRKDLIARIPAHTPEWINPQEGDPGRTLIDLFAWLGDALLYRANLIPERQRLEFLRLLNVPMRGARAASGLVRLEVASERVEQAVDVDRYTAIQGPVEFETNDEITVLPLFGRVYAKRLPTEGEREEFGAIQDGLEDLYGITAQHDVSGQSAERKSRPYVTTPLFEDIPHDPDGFDFVTNTVDGSLWIALLAANADKQLHSKIQEAFKPNDRGARLLSIGVQPRLTIPAFGDPVTTPLEMIDLWQWEVPSERESPADDPYHIPYLPLEVRQDTTNGFTTAGVVKLALPQQELWAPPNDVDDNIYAGTGNRPPRIDDEEIASRLVGWVRLRPRQVAGNLGLMWMGINAVAVDQLRTVENVVVSTSTGAPDQAVSLPAGSVDKASFRLEVEEPELGYQQWNERPLHEAGRDDKVFELDGEAGLVKFGDGVRGAVPERNMRLRVGRLRYGGGRHGNVPAGNLTAISLPNLKLSQPLDMTGGEDAESLEQAERRIPEELRHGRRAVTAADYREIARHTPAVDLGRVDVLPKFKPQQRLEDIVGVVSVMVLPKAVHRLPPNPRPDRNTLARVHAYLEERRPIGVELYVIGTEYVPIALSVAARLRDGFPRNEVLRNVEGALRDFLWPLAPGGHDQEGWPLGQKVVDQQLEVVVARVRGVLAVRGIRLFQQNESGLWEMIPEHLGRRKLTLEAWQLPELLAVVADDADQPRDVIDELVSPTTGGAVDPEDSAPGGGETVIPIPVVPEMCR